LISDADWFGIREAARCRRWEEVAERAEALGWPIVAKHARRAGHDFDSLATVVWALLLDQPDAPDPFAADG
jgi:hypothetical protein